MYTLHVIVAVWICDWHHQGVTRPASSVPVWVNCLRQIKTVISGLQLQPLSHFWLKYCKQPHYQPPLWALQSASLILRISARLSASSAQMALHINSASCWLSSLFVLVQRHVLSFSVVWCIGSVTQHIFFVACQTAGCWKSPHWLVCPGFVATLSLKTSWFGCSSQMLTVLSQHRKWDYIQV